VTKVTIKDVAKRAGVSTATVSRVLNDDPRVTPAYRQAVLDAVSQLNYRRDRIARNLRVRYS
jgi:DNA-binding LacI/PurR family transcriptional regulator